jgi:hypothetical protein
MIKTKNPKHTFRVLILRRKRFSNSFVTINVFSTSCFVNRHRVTYRVTTFLKYKLYKVKIVFWFEKNKFFESKKKIYLNYTYAFKIY